MHLLAWFGLKSDHRTVGVELRELAISTSKTEPNGIEVPRKPVPTAGPPVIGFETREQKPAYKFCRRLHAINELDRHAAEKFR